MVVSFLASIVTMAIAASLESHWRNTRFPSISHRDRERILLTAGVWGIVISLYSLIGTLVKPDHIAFGILFHLIAFVIAFILYMVGSASLTALVDGVDCGDVDWSRCNVTKGLVVIGWIETVIVFIILIIVVVLGFKARSGSGLRRSALTDA
ncbi:uncharacterized protein JCM10292_001213 [Rhodotorula paludigena]|uniref:uncharacterized protein n=1 Tax=Rhodotorula paludigena TaxID=86838 RepID=UPI003172FBD9